MRRVPFLSALKRLDIEEKILNVGALIAIIGVFLPWFGGTWFGEPRMWSGFGFYTSFVGWLIFLAHVCTVALTVLPLMGHAIVRSSVRDLIRLIVGIQSVVLIIMVLSIFMRISFDFSQVETRFGVYVTLVGSIVVALYGFLRVQQQRRRNVEQLFRHPEDDAPPPPRTPSSPKRDVSAPPPSPKPEEARVL